MKNAKNYMMIFRFEPNLSQQPTEEQINTQKQLWGSFIGNIAIQEKLVSTYRLGFESSTLHPDHSVSSDMNTSKGQIVSGNMIVKASTKEEAVEMAKECPILGMGGSIEVREIMPIEG